MNKQSLPLRGKNWKIILFGILTAHLLFLLKLKFTAWPEMLLWPYLIIKGWLPYQDIAIAHTPLMLADLAIFFKLFGVGITQLKIFTWILILILDYAVFSISKKLWNTRVAIFSLIPFVLWQLFFDGNGLWFDIYMGLFALLSFYFVKKKNLLFAGIFWALAVISKQTAVWFLLPIAVELVKGKRHELKEKTTNFIFGGGVIFILFTLLLFTLHLLPSFYDWAIKFGIFILPRAAGQIQLPNLKNLFVAVFPFLIFIPLVLSEKKKDWSLMIWAIAGAMGAYPRFEYFHFQPSIPYLAIAAGTFFSNINWKDFQIKVYSVLYVLGSLCLLSGFFLRNYNEGTRFLEREVLDVSTYVKSHTDDGDRIFVMNWWDNIYPLTDTLPGNDPWVPQLSWYIDIPGIQESIVNDLRIEKPKLILLNPYSNTGLSSYQPKLIYDYVIGNYRLKEKIDGIEIFVPR
jgi:hypothetical protein